LKGTAELRAAALQYCNGDLIVLLCWLRRLCIIKNRPQASRTLAG
jgi:hypothetical protein